MVLAHVCSARVPARKPMSYERRCFSQTNVFSMVCVQLDFVCPPWGFTSVVNVSFIKSNEINMIVLDSRGVPFEITSCNFAGCVICLPDRFEDHGCCFGLMCFDLANVNLNVTGQNWIGAF